MACSKLSFFKILNLINVTDGQKVWSSGYGRRLVYIMLLNASAIYRKDIFMSFCYNNCDVFLKKTKKLKRVQGWPIFKKINASSWTKWQKHVSLTHLD